MPLESTPQSKLKYFLFAFDAQGNERTDDPDGRMSTRLIETLQREAPDGGRYKSSYIILATIF